MAYSYCMNPDDTMAIQEAMRRMTGQAASGAGFSGGMPQANAMMPTQRISTQPQNPVAQFAQAQQAPTPQMGGGSPMQRFINPDQTAALDTAKPDQTTIVLKSLTKFLDRITPQPQGM